MMRQAEWLLTPERAAVHLPTATAVIADLHLGYSLARQRAGEAVPAGRIEEALIPLLRLRAQRLVIAGDLLEDARCEPLVDELQQWLEQAGIELVGIVPGNHDGGLQGCRNRVPVFPEGFQVGGWRVVHGDGPLGSGATVQGHVHPCLRWGRRVAVPCYLEAEEHLALPAFSPDAAGVNVLRDARWQRYRCHAIAGDRVLDLGEVARLRKAGATSAGGFALRYGAGERETASGKEYPRRSYQ